MFKLRDKKILVGMAFVWAFIIFMLCALPGEDIPDPHLNIPHLDKIVHGGMFFIMSLLIVLPFELHTSLTTKQIYAIAIGVALGYGGLIEILQHYFFNRGGDVWDLLADVAGGVIGCVFYPVVRRMLHIEN